MPREANIVYDPNVTVFSDEGLTTPLENVHGVILETRSPGGVSKSFRVYPSSQTHFKKGKSVSWEWSMSLIVGAAWYRDAATGQAKQAWLSSAEFVGRHLDELRPTC